MYFLMNLYVACGHMPGGSWHLPHLSLLDQPKVLLRRLDEQRGYTSLGHFSEADNGKYSMSLSRRRGLAWRFDPLAHLLLAGEGTVGESLLEDALDSVFLCLATSSFPGGLQLGSGFVVIGV